MRLYRVLLVDDEDEIRSGIITKIEWERNGFKLIGDANNGEDALEMAETLCPDVVLTDIRMPFMSGLELCQRLSEKLPSCKLVIFSGYDDFEYAQQAIKMNVFEYILKPISSQKLTSVLQNLKKQMDLDINERRNIEILKKYYQDSIPLIREQFYIRLVEGRVTQQKLDEYSTKYGLTFPSGRWIVMIFRPEYPINCTGSLSNNINFVPISAKRIIDDGLKKFSDYMTFMYDDDIVAIVHGGDNENILDYINAANRSCNEVKRVLEFNLSAGIGLMAENILNLRQSYKGALSALDYRVLMGSNKAIYIGDVESQLPAQLDFNEQDERELIRAIKLGTKDDIQLVIDMIIKKIKDARLQLTQCQIILMEIQTSLIKLARYYNLDVEELFSMKDRCYVQFTDFSSLSEMSSWLYRICTKISSIIRLQRINSTRLIAMQAKEYIDEHYGDSDMSVETLCKILHLSPAYFSTLFKREIGMSFINYLTSVRMEKAAFLLTSTDDKTYLISQRTGYADPNYFSYVFKKYYGISPSKFRAQKSTECSA